jgi:DNA-binding beta-propeller fold protein YncE
MNKIWVYFLLVTTTLYACNISTKPDDKKREPSSYKLDAPWPKLAEGSTLGQPTGIGMDSKDHVFIFHRAGRKWIEPFPDSAISSSTIVELENETGRVLNSWGAKQFIMPHGLNVDKQDNIWVTDVALHQVFKFSHDGHLLLQLGVPKVSGNDSLHFNLPTDVAVADDGSFYVSDGYGNSRVVKFTPAGKYILQWGSHGNKSGEFDIPHAITLDQSGHVFVADRQNNRIQVFDSIGHFIKEIKNDEQVAQLPSLTLDKEQHLLAVDYDFSSGIDTVIKGSTVFKFDSKDQVVFHFGWTGEKQRKPCWFHDIAIDRQGNIFAGDIMGMKVFKYKLKHQQSPQ